MRPSCCLSSHRSFGIRIWRRIRCRSSTACFRSNSGYCPGGSPIMTLPAISTLPLRPSAVMSKRRHAKPSWKIIGFLVDEVGRLQTNCAFCQHVLQRVETDRCPARDLIPMWATVAPTTLLSLMLTADRFKPSLKRALPNAHQL